MFDPLPLVVEMPGDVVQLVAAAEQAASAWQLPAPNLIRVGANGVFECGDVILRVGRATAPMDLALRFAERIADAGIRVALPARDRCYDAAGGLSVTAWHRIRVDHEAPIDWVRVGAMVASLHAIDPATVDHPLPFCADFPWWNLDLIVPEMHGPLVDDAARAGMQAALDEHGWWVERCRHEPVVLCHGDVHPGNVLVDADGPVLIDWDLLCVGPSAWDHAALMPWTSRWGGQPGMYEAYRAGYLAAGGPPVDAAVARAISEMRLLIATLMRLRRARVAPEIATSEALRRLAFWRGETDAPMWQAQ